MGTIKFIAVLILIGIMIYFLLISFEIRRMAKDFDLEVYYPGFLMIMLNLLFPFTLIWLIILFL